MSKKVILEFDGASKGNPGRAGAGAVIKSVDGSVLAKVREGMGTDTNNAAEYRALNRGMQTALDMGYDSIHVKGDSQLVHKQVQGEWQTRNPNMSRYCSEARYLKSQFKSFDMEHVPRVQGEWQTRNPNMSRYCSEARYLKSQFKSFDLEHVPRGSNRDADAEANKAVNLPPGHVEKEGGSRSYYY